MGFSIGGMGGDHGISFRGMKSGDVEAESIGGVSSTREGCASLVGIRCVYQYRVITGEVLTVGVFGKNDSSLFFNFLVMGHVRLLHIKIDDPFSVVISGVVLSVVISRSAAGCSIDGNISAENTKRRGKEDAA